MYILVIDRKSISVQHIKGSKCVCVLSFIKKLLVKLWIHWLWDHTVQLALKKKRNRKPHTFLTPNSHRGKKTSRNSHYTGSSKRLEKFILWK